MESRTEKLGDIADITTGKTPSKRIENAYGNVIKFLTPRDFSGRFSVTTERMLSDQGYQAVYNQIVSGPSVSVTCIGSDMGKVIYNRESVVTNQQVNTLSNFKSNVDPLFLYYLLSTKKQELLSYGAGNGSTMPIITKSMFSKLEIKLPSVKVQRKLVACLSLLDDKIELNQQINKNLLRLAKQQFNLTFPNVHEGNSRLSDVMENFDRKRIPLARREREKRQGVYRYVGATSVLDYVDDYLFDGTYLLMGEDGTVQDEKGFPILQYIWGKFWPNNHTHVLSGTFVSTEWLYLFLMNTNVRSRITGAVQQKISQANMNSIPLTIPSKDELFRFQKQIEPMFSQIQLLDEQNLKLTAIHKLLLPKLLAGQIDLSNLEGAIQNA